MAINKIQAGAQPVLTLGVIPTDPITTDTPLSGEPCVLGNLFGVALIDGAYEGKVVIDIGPSIFDLSVTADSAIAAGDVLYYHTGQTINNTSSGGIRAGIALEAIASGTATIKVLIGK